jgi:hypothetical protein
MDGTGASGRARAAERIRKLRNVTVDRGATEAEALSAARLALELMSEYGFTEEDLSVEEEREVRDDGSDLGAGEENWHSDLIAGAVAYLTDTMLVGHFTPRGKITFFGLGKDAEIARYLFAVCMGAMRRSREEYAATQVLMRPSVRLRNVRSFLLGMAPSLAGKVMSLKPSNAGTGLVVAKKALIEAEVRKRHDRLRDANVRSGRVADEDAYGKGEEAGRRVILMDAVSGDGQGPTVESLAGPLRPGDPADR